MQKTHLQKPAYIPYETIRKGKVTRIINGFIQVQDAVDPHYSCPCHHLRTTAGLAPDYQVGDEVLYTLAENDTVGYIFGIVELYQPVTRALNGKLKQTGSQTSVTTLQDEVVHIKADKGLVIECGSGTIIITQDGKIQIKGKELLSRARGMNKIKGAGVDIN